MARFIIKNISEENYVLRRENSQPINLPAGTEQDVELPDGELLKMEVEKQPE